MIMVMNNYLQLLVLAIYIPVIRMTVGYLSWLAVVLYICIPTIPASTWYSSGPELIDSYILAVQANTG